MLRSCVLALVLCGACQPTAPAPQTPVTPTPSAEVAPAAGARAQLAARREIMLDRLRAYGEAGVLPLDERGLPLSVFRDADGRECPMAHLITRSGRKDLVDAVVRDNNRLRLADVTEGPLMDWMRTSGLTRDEIIEVQGILELDVRFDLETGELNQVILADTRNNVQLRALVVEQKLRANTETSLELLAAAPPAAPSPAWAPVVPAHLVARETEAFVTSRRTNPDRGKPTSR